jgi:hypothetical protein
MRVFFAPEPIEALSGYEKLVTYLSQGTPHAGSSKKIGSL